LSQYRPPGIGLRSASALLHLLGALPDHVSGSRTGGSSNIRRVEFVPGDVKRNSSIDPVPIREGTALNVGAYLSRSPISLSSQLVSGVRSHLLTARLNWASAAQPRRPWAFHAVPARHMIPPSARWVSSC